jgi:4-amino-4-deoxy-L-arabinose transferase-like glycosyltransferase
MKEEMPNIAAPGKPSALLICKVLLIVFIVLIFIYRASDTLVSDHATGDQRPYLGIAMKLDRFGFREYNLYRINRIYSEGGVEYVYSGEDDGELLEDFRKEGIGFFGQPYYHTPPLISYLLLFSHRLFSPRQEYLILLPAAARQMGFAQRLKIQFYSSFVSVFFGVVLIVATFLLGRALFDYWTAAVAMLLIAVSPAVLLASERIWQDTPVAALIAITILFLLWYSRSKNATYFVLSAISYGCALLTKNTASLLAPTILLIVFYFSYRKDGFTKSVVPAAIKLAIFFLLVSIITLPWYYTAYSTWGTPFYNAGKAGISKVQRFYIFSESRPWYTYLISLPSMVPLYLFGYYRLINLLRSKVLPNELFLAVWFLTFFIVLTIITFLSEQLGPDSRYMLPAYPPLAILTALQLLSFKRWLESKLPLLVTRFALVAILVLSSTWSFTLSDPFYAEFPAVYKHFMNMPW